LRVGEFGRRAAIRREDLGFDVEVRGVDGAREAGYLVFLDVVGKLKDVLQRDVGCGKYDVVNAHAEGLLVGGLVGGVVLLDGDDVVGGKVL